MKHLNKYLLIATISVIAVSLSACSSNIQTPSSTSANDINKENQSSDIIDLSPTSNNNQAEPVASSSMPEQAIATSSMENNQAPSAATFATLNNQSDLASIYSKAILHTNYGDITLAFYPIESPKTVNNFLNLAKEGFYDTVKFHRVIKGFMIQGGDPNSKDDDWSNDGYGGPGYKFEDEINSHKLVRGSLAMANSGPDTNGSQFFIVTAESTPYLDGGYTNFGYVVSGMDAVDKIENLPTNDKDHPTDDAIINSVELVK